MRGFGLEWRKECAPSEIWDDEVGSCVPLVCSGPDLAFQGRCIGPAEQQIVGPTLCAADEEWDPLALTVAQGKQVVGGCRKKVATAAISSGAALSFAVFAVLGLATTLYLVRR